jgi:hypothetical protein
VELTPTRRQFTSTRSPNRNVIGADGLGLAKDSLGRGRRLPGDAGRATAGVTEVPDAAAADADVTIFKEGALLAFFDFACAATLARAPIQLPRLVKRQLGTCVGVGVWFACPCFESH